MPRLFSEVAPCPCSAIRVSVRPFFPPSNPHWITLLPVLPVPACVMPSMLKDTKKVLVDSNNC